MAYRILVVDDEAEIVALLTEKLLKHGYAVSSAADGEEALAKVASDNPDIILLDLMLPKLNGFQVLKEVRARFKDKWRPIIIVSGKTELASVKESYSLEADHYLTKPCDLDKILRGIETMISLIPLRKDSKEQ